MPRAHAYAAVADSSAHRLSSCFTLAPNMRMCGRMDSRELETLVLDMQEQLSWHAIVI